MTHTFTLLTLTTALLVMVTTFASAQTHTPESCLPAATTDWIDTLITSQTVGGPTDLVYRP
ncbi:hypothetical protein [Monaibacterium marinum]|uniref:hypothetical protein n=1 Tax=Pontivivens marinum TaxID=1690039 RepID=UPI000BF0E976|nr:hypothetical protein [Monaibacterium marinum]